MDYEEFERRINYEQTCAMTATTIRDISIHYDKINRLAADYIRCCSLKEKINAREITHSAIQGIHRIISQNGIMQRVLEDAIHTLQQQNKKSARQNTGST
jgi:hypothetical protein